MCNKQPWTFVYAADMQPGSPRSFRYRPALMENWHSTKRQIIANKPQFWLNGGDITRDGLLHDGEFVEMKDEFDSMGIPYHTIPGNMDVGNKHTARQGFFDSRDDIALNMKSKNLARYEKFFGPAYWTFDHKNVRVTGFCDMLLGSSQPKEEKLWKFLEELKKLPPIDHHLILMHYAMFIDDIDEETFDITKEDEYMQWYFGLDKPIRMRLLKFFKAANVTRVVTGHIHCRKDFTAAGICFDLAPSATCGQWSDKWPDGDISLGFFRYDVNGREITKTFIPLENISQRTDFYGPGGHPKPEFRNYSMAWQKPAFK
ncbi:MAG: metallophosphoesterase [Victivallaceae bacterium]|nr:metallophosphoesterase [Victivallaceae bacterium]